MNGHVTDDLELYALGALPEPEAARVGAHLAACRECREHAAALEDVALALPDTLPERDAPPGLRERILATARGELAAARTARDTAWTARTAPAAATPRPPGARRLLAAALALAVLVLAAVDLRTQQELARADAERAAYAAALEKVSHGGRTWYMAGLDQWAGSGGTLIAPAKPELKPFIVFHDLRPIDGGSVYALWLIDAQGFWTRAANFVPNGATTQSVDLDARPDGYMQCALTVETSREGRRSGPLVMQSRIASQ